MVPKYKIPKLFPPIREAFVLFAETEEPCKTWAAHMREQKWKPHQTQDQNWPNVEKEKDWTKALIFEIGVDWVGSVVPSEYLFIEDLHW